MKYVRFISAECQLTGEMGFAVKGTDTSHHEFGAALKDSTLLVHDVFEHQNGIVNIGSVEDELEALGGIWHCRGRHHDLSRGRSSCYGPHESIAGDILQMFMQSNGGNIKHIDAQKETGFEDDFKDILRASIDLCKNEDPETWDRAQFARFAILSIRWMQSGYHKANKRFGTECTSNSLFWEVKESLDKSLNHARASENDEIILGYKFKRGVEVTCRVVSPWENGHSQYEPEYYR